MALLDKFTGTLEQDPHWSSGNREDAAFDRYLRTFTSHFPDSLRRVMVTEAKRFQKEHA